MNNFANDVTYAMFHNFSFAVCVPPGMIIWWLRFFHDAGIPQCQECVWDKDYNGETAVRTARLFYDNRFRRADVERTRRYVYGRLFRPKQTVLQAWDESRSNLGLAGVPYVGVHVRRQDKIAEAAPVGIEAYAREVASFCKSLSIAHVYIASDDARVYEQLKQLLGPVIRVVRQRRLPSSAYLKRGEDYDSKAITSLIVDLLFLSHARSFVGTGSSNLARFVYFLRADHHHAVSLDDDFLSRAG